MRAIPSWPAPRNLHEREALADGNADLQQRGDCANEDKRGTFAGRQSNPAVLNSIACQTGSCLPVAISEYLKSCCLCAQHQGILSGTVDPVWRKLPADSCSELRDPLPQRAQPSGLGNRLIFPDAAAIGTAGVIQRRERLGGMLNYYYRAAA
jgi:hypothetical protein